MAAYLKSTGRADIAELATRHRKTYLTADPKAEYDEHHKIDLNTLEVRRFLFPARETCISHASPSFPL